MKPKLLLGLALVLSGGLLGCSTASVSARQPGLANRDNLQWGETVAGFQMANSLDVTNGIIHCWIRNATTNEVDCPGFDFGYGEFVRLEVLVGTNWVSLSPWVFPRGNDPSYYTNSIQAGQVVNLSCPMAGRSDLIVRAALVAGMHFPHPKLLQKMTEKIDQRWAQLTNLCDGDTFALDFATGNPFAASGLTSQSPLKARVSQKFRVAGGGKMLTLQSPEFNCPVFRYDAFILSSFANRLEEFDK